MIQKILNLFRRPPSNHPGCGKSRIVRKWCRKHGVRYHNTKLTQWPVDLFRSDR